MAALFCLTAEPAAAQGTGIYTPLMRVETVLAGAEDDRVVGLSGHIVRKVDDRTFLFADNTGEIAVDIDEDLITGSYRLEPGTPVEVWGEVETRLFRQPRVEAHTVSVLVPGGLPTIIYRDTNRTGNRPAQSGR